MYVCANQDKTCPQTETDWLKLLAVFSGLVGIVAVYSIKYRYATDSTEMQLNKIIFSPRMNN